jgi:TolB protein
MPIYLRGIILVQVMILLLVGCGTAETRTTDIPSTGTPTMEYPTDTAFPTYTPFPATITPTESPTDIPFPTRTSTPIPRGSGGGLITFTSSLYGSYDIFIMNADGSGLQRLTRDPGTEGYAALSPDGKRIAFYAYDDLVTWSIYAMDIDGENRERLTNREGVRDSAPQWSPDGTQIIFSSEIAGGFEIWVMNADGSDQRRIEGVSGMGPKWLPDGGKILYCSMEDGETEVYLMDVDGTNQRQLTDNDSHEWWPAWSPDGARIAFMSDRDGNWEIYVMTLPEEPDAVGTDQQRLTRSDAEDWAPRWSPDGEHIIFLSDIDGDMDIYIMDPDGGNQEELFGGPEREIQASWWPYTSIETEDTSN